MITLPLPLSVYSQHGPTGQKAREGVDLVLLRWGLYCSACQSTPSLGLCGLHPKAKAKGRTRKQCVYYQSPAFALFAQGSLSFLVKFWPCQLGRPEEADLLPAIGGHMSSILLPAWPPAFAAWLVLVPSET